jgi:hypothetical protein
MDAIPSIRIAPIFFLRSKFRTWLQVDPLEDGEKVPQTADKLTDHLLVIQQAAIRLREQIEYVLEDELVLQSLEAHYKDESDFRAMKGVTELEPTPGARERRFIVLTGAQTHYLKAQGEFSGCRWHEWKACSDHGKARPYAAVLVRSVKPRSFFVTGEEHHCAHRDVIGPKEIQITSENEARCGPRSGAAFCEIYPFEQRLCCRACAFETVCTGAEMFRELPCEHAALRLESNA